MAIEQTKANSGLLDGLASSKKLGLTFTFVTTCFGLLPTVATQLMQIALVSAAVLAVVAYLVSQAIVEAAWGKTDESEEAPCSVPSTVTSPTASAHKPKK